MSVRAAAAITLLLTSALACAGNADPASAPEDQPEELQVIRVENEMPVTLRVLSLEGGGETMLGRVPAAGEATLHLRAPVSGAIRLVARPSAGRSARRHVSEPIQISPGQRITWKLRFSPGVSDVPNLSSFGVSLRQ